MSTILKKAQQILEEKNTKLLPENIKARYKLLWYTSELWNGEDENIRPKLWYILGIDQIAFKSLAKVIRSRIYFYRYSDGTPDEICTILNNIIGGNN